MEGKEKEKKERKRERKKERDKKKERKKEKKHTDSIVRIRACASLQTVSFACLKLHHAAKETKHKIPPISECRDQSRDPPTEKETLLRRLQMQIRVKKVTLIVQISFAEKK